MRAYGGTDINHAPYFLSINPEILSVDLDIKSPEGMARLRELIARSDIVINNLRPGAMERQGLGYRAAHGDQAGHHLGVDQDVGQRRAAGSSNRLRAVFRRAGRARFAGRLPRWASPRGEHALRGFHGRRGRRIRRRGGLAASRTQRRRPIRRRVGRRNPLLDDRGLPARTKPHRKAPRAQRQQPSRHVPARLLPLLGWFLGHRGRGQRR